MRFILACLSIFAVSTLPAQGSPAATLAWGPAPAMFPPGAKMAIVSGDPGAMGMFTVELAMPDGYRIPPHFHPTDEGVEVKEGTFLFAMGDTFDGAKLQSMAVGQKGSIPANAHHYAQAKGATVVAVTAMGPFAMTYVNPADDPRKPLTKP